MSTATKPAPKQRIRCESTGMSEIRAVTTDDLADGTCGRVTLIGLRYNQPDAYGTIFKPGCLAKSVGQKVSAGRVKYYADHIYKTTEHIGVVRAVEDVGQDVLVSADIFDTESGRRYLEYAKACLGAKAQTGCSIGFYDRKSDLEEIDGVRYWAYEEVELEEFSGTPNNAVEGADLLAARRQPDTERLGVLRRALEGLLKVIPESDIRAAIAARFASGTEVAKPAAPAAAPATGNAEDGVDSAHVRDAAPKDSPAAAPSAASMDDRLAVVRRSYATPTLP